MKGVISLHDAAGRGDVAAVEAILAKGAAVDGVPNRYCLTPLAHAARKGHIAVVTLLISRGAAIGGGRYETPLSSTIAGKHAGTALLLLRHGADCMDCHLVSKALDANLPDVAKEMIRRGALADANQLGAALHQAASKGQGEVVDCILANGAPIEWRNTEGETALHQAAWAGSLDALQKLSCAGADVRAVDVRGRTPLHLAASEDRHGAVRALLGKGSEVNVQDFLGFTPLHLAVRNGCFSTAQVLVERGADPKVADFFGNSSLRWAQHNAALTEVLSPYGTPAETADDGPANTEPPAAHTRDRARAVSFITKRVVAIAIEAGALKIEAAKVWPAADLLKDFRLDLDSLTWLQFVVDLEDEFDIGIPDETAQKLYTVSDVVEYVLEALLPPLRRLARPALPL